MRPLFLPFFALFFYGINAQVGINTTDPKSLLDIPATNASTPTATDGILIPRINAFPATNPGADQNGMLVFLSTTVGANSPGFYYWEQASASWVPVGNNTNTGWKLTGNMASTSDYFGTNNDQDVVFRRFGSLAGTIGAVNTSFGWFSGQGGGVRKASFGFQALQINGGSDNSAFGYQSMITAGNGSANAAFGSFTLNANTTGGLNTAIGSEALRNNTTGDANTAVGGEALKANIVGIQNTAVGKFALQSNLSNNNTAVGANALSQNTSGSSNTAMGLSALNGNTTASGNSAFGFLSLLANTTGNLNTAMGHLSLNDNTSGSNNVAIGQGSLALNTVGQSNTSVGQISMNTTTTGGFNTAVGRQSLISNVTGGFNNAIGYLADVASGNLINATAIGTRALVGTNNAMVLGSINGVNGATATVNVGIGTSTPQDRLHVVGNLRLEDGNQAAGKILTSDANGTATWTNVSASGGWGIIGNTGTNSATNFMGTNDNQSLLFKTNNIERLTLSNTGKAFIGTTVPTSDTWAGFSKVVVGTNDTDNDVTLRSSGTDIPAFNILRSSGTMGSPTVFTTGEIGSLRFWRYTGLGPFDGYVPAGRIVSGIDAAGSTKLLLSGSGGSAQTGVTITDTGFFGVGTSSPTRKLHIVNVEASGGTPFGTAGLVLESNAQVYQQFLTPSSFESGLLFGNEISNIRAGILFNSAITDGLSFRTGGNNTRVAIHSDGSVGIGTGTTVPTARLQVEGGVIFNETSADVDFRVESNNNANMLLVDASDDSVLIGTNTLSPELLRVGQTTGDGIQIGSAEIIEDGGFLTFQVNANFVPTTNNALDIGSGTLRWQDIFATNGTIQTSDRNTKTNIENIEYGLEEIMKLRPVTFNWKEQPNGSKKLGFIAQELLPVIAEVVKTEDEILQEDGTVKTEKLQNLGVYYSDIIPVLVKAIQEQQVQIEALQNQIKSLEKQ